MNRTELLELIDERFEMYVDKKINLEQLRSFIRDLIHAYSDHITDILDRVRGDMNKVH